MPIVQTYKGHILVEGSSNGFVVGGDNTQDIVYSKKVFAYGETIGELLDNLVQASVTIANDAFQWALRTQPADYTPADDYWYCAFVHPEIVPNPDWPIDDASSGSNITAFEHIVQRPALFRDVSIHMAASTLELVKPGPSSISTTAAVRYSDIHNASSFQEMTEYGFQGAELDSILEIAKAEGRLHSPELKVVKDLQRKSRWSAYFSGKSSKS